MNSSSSNGLVPSGKKPLPEPMLTQIYVTTWCHQFIMSWNYMYLVEQKNTKIVAILFSTMYAIHIDQATILSHIAADYISSACCTLEEQHWYQINDGLLKSVTYGWHIEWEDDDDQEGEIPGDEGRQCDEDMLLTPVTIAMQQQGWQHSCHDNLHSQRADTHGEEWVRPEPLTGKIKTS